MMCTYNDICSLEYLYVSVEVHFLISLNGRSAQVSVITGIDEVGERLNLFHLLALLRRHYSKLSAGNLSFELLSLKYSI